MAQPATSSPAHHHETTRELAEDSGVEVEVHKIRETLSLLAKEGVMRQLRQNTFSVM